MNCFKGKFNENLRGKSKNLRRRQPCKNEQNYSCLRFRIHTLNVYLLLIITSAEKFWEKSTYNTLIDVTFLCVLFIESSKCKCIIANIHYTGAANSKKKKDVETKNIFFSYESGDLNHSKIFSQRNLFVEKIRFKPTGGRTFSTSFLEISPLPWRIVKCRH